MSQWNPDEDVEEGEILFDDGSDRFDAIQDDLEDRAILDNCVDASGWSLADFIYDPIGRK